MTERRQVAGLEKGDLLEARLLPYEGKLVFSGAFLYHPREARKLILAEVKRLKKAAGKAGPARPGAVPGHALAHGLQAGAVPERPAGVDLRLHGRAARA